LQLTRPGSGMYVQDFNDSSRWQRFQTTGNPVAKTGYTEIPIVWLSESGVPLQNQTVIVVLSSPPVPT
jgi:hypothetical protein